MRTTLALAFCLTVTLPSPAQNDAARAQAPATKAADPQSVTQEKSLGEVARAAKQQPKAPAAIVVDGDDVATAKPGDQSTSPEQQTVVQHFQEFASNHTQEETRSELQSWMHTELLKLLGNKPGDATKSNEQLIDDAKKQSPDSDSARIDQLLQQIREAGLLDDSPNHDAPPK